MRKLRLIKPWRLQTRRQRTGFDRLEMMCSTADVITCRGPQDDAWLEEREQSNPRTITVARCRFAGPAAMDGDPRMERGPRA